MHIILEGIDRCGKGSLHKYLERLGNFKYIIDDRGILTQLVYNEKFNRGVEYNLDEYKKDLIIYLYADPKDLEIRFKMTNEPSLYKDLSIIEGINKDLKIYDKYVNILNDEGYIIYSFNTTNMTPYNVAKSIIHILEVMEEKGEIKI